MSYRGSVIAFFEFNYNVDGNGFGFFSLKLELVTEFWEHAANQSRPNVIGGRAPRLKRYCSVKLVGMTS